MVPKIAKILYATDLSASASYAFGYALSLAKSYEAKISIINVYEKLTSNVNFQMRNADVEATKKRLEDIIRLRLDQYLEKEESTECQYRKYVENVYVSSGAPVTSILEHAREGGYDLIVMGTHGHGFLYSAMIGSTAQKMVQQSDIPVLVVRLNGKH